MTRETKVGLVVGTGIILLIGIVVSDHLSAQQRGQQQTAAPTGYSDVSTGNAARTVDPRGQVRPLVDAGDDAKSTPLPPAGNNPRGTGTPREGARTAAIELNNIARNPDGSPAMSPADRNPQPPAAVGAATDPGSRVVDRNLPAGITNDLRQNGFLPEDNTPRLANNSATTTVPNAAGVRPTEPLIHHVQAGESLWAIAEKFYGVGNGRYYSEIAKANADKLLPDGGVREGVRLIIPNKVIVAPGTVGTSVAERHDLSPPVIPRESTGTVPATPANPGTGRTVKVEPGDALSTIATRTLGSIRHMQLIIDANKDQIHDADDIKAGMILRIPELPSATTPTTPTVPAAPATPTPPSTPGVTATAKVHKVQPRDTFSSIARTRLGNDKRWKELFELNKDKVRTPDALREGIVLVLPSDAR